VSFKYNGQKITNLEMETSGIYGMAALLGHSALSLNVILANRADGTFSTNAPESIENLITHTLGVLVS
jgi:uridine phosphorylase